MRNSRPPVSGEDLDSVERRLGVSLPDEYRAFLLKHNGGRPSPNIFAISGNTEDTHGILNWFYCIQEGDTYDLIKKAGVFRERVPADLLPIAEDPGGNQLCLGISGANRGALFFWSHEEEADEGEPPTHENVYPVAESFDRFIADLRDDMS